MDIDSEWLPRLFTVIPVILILLAGSGALWIYFFVLSLLPAAHSSANIPELRAEVLVVRDPNGVPGIIGESERDVALVFGYIMAQDRLWQMDFLRRAGQGRVAEILGVEFLERDHIMRSLAVGVDMDSLVDDLSPPQRLWLRSFVRGINRYISSHTGKLPVEFSLLEYQPQLFTEQDVFWIARAVAWESSPAHVVDPVMTRIVAERGIEEALPLMPSDPAVTAGRLAAHLREWRPAGPLFAQLSSRAAGNLMPGFRGGCVWAVAGRRTQSGKPMLGASTYQSLVAPGSWYRARLATDTVQVSGAFVPGLPVAISGSNGRLSWAGVSVPADDADLFIEVLDGSPPRRYWKVDRWRSLGSKVETYAPRDGSHESRTVLLSDTGPILSDVSDNRALSLRWTAREGTGLFETFHRLNRAQDGQAAIQSLQYLVAPPMKVIWADGGGRYGVQFGGSIPVRAPESDGVLPAPAWTGVHDWKGFVPPGELPAAINPPAGSIVSADERPALGSYSLFMGSYWDSDARRDRITELLSSEKQLHPEVFQLIHTDVVSPLARELTPRIINAVMGRFEEGTSEEQAARILMEWDQTMTKESAAAAIFGLTYQALVETMLRERLGDDLYFAFSQYVPLTTSLVRRTFLNDDENWIGDADRKKQVLSEAFERAVTRGGGLMGSDPSQWAWGRIHQAVFAHPVTKRSRFLELVYQVGPVATGGSRDTVDCAAWINAIPFRVIEGVSLRLTADMTDPPQVFHINPMGASGHFFSKHYKDQTRAWLDGRSFKEPILRADIRKNGFNAVLFKPAHATAQSKGWENRAGGRNGPKKSEPASEASSIDQ
jgi:penicillin amidase